MSYEYKNDELFKLICEQKGIITASQNSDGTISVLTSRMNSYGLSKNFLKEYEVFSDNSSRDTRWYIRHKKSGRTTPNHLVEASEQSRLEKGKKQPEKPKTDYLGMMY